MPKSYRPFLGGPPRGPWCRPCSMSWTERLSCSHSAQQDDHTGQLGQAQGFAQCCETQATLSAKVENQSKMPTSEEHACGGNKEKTQRGSQKRPGEPEESANGPMNCKLDFKVSVPQRGWVVVGIFLSLWLWEILQSYSYL